MREFDRNEKTHGGARRFFGSREIIKIVSAAVMESAAGNGNTRINSPSYF